MQRVLDDAIEQERRRQFFEAANASYTALKADPKAWAEILAERAMWDVTLMDGLDPNERWPELEGPRRSKHSA